MLLTHLPGTLMVVKCQSSTKDLLTMKRALIPCSAFSITGKSKVVIYTEVKRWDRRRGRNLPPPAAEPALGNISLCFISSVHSRT